MGSRVAVCINNYNYADYVVQAINSALMQTDPPDQIVVVDDGSTDDSIERLRAFGDAITLIEQPNGGQASTRNAAFEVVDADWIIFLDADDLLEPDCIEELRRTVRPEMSKVHWRLDLVDEVQRHLGTNPSKRQPLARGDVRDLLLSSGWYSTVPMSGNCWSRALLDRVMPVPVDDFLTNVDGYLNLAAGLMGPIGAIDRALARYRIHGANDFATRGHFDAEVAAYRLSSAAIMDRWLPKLAARFGCSAEPGTVLGHPDFVLMDLALRRLRGERPGRASLASARRLLRAAGVSDFAARRRYLMRLAAPVVALAPRAVVQHVLDIAFAGKPFLALPWRRP